MTSDPALVAQSRRRMEQFAAAMGFEAQRVSEIGLCLNEALANVIRHAYGSGKGCPIEVSAEAREAELEIQIRDWGCGANPAVEMNAHQHDPLQPGGLGLVCLKSLMDEVQFLPQSDGMVLRLVRHRQEKKI